MISDNQVAASLSAGGKCVIRSIRPSKRDTERAKRAAAPPRSKPGDGRRLTSAANLPRMAGWNRWRPARRVIDVPGEGQREQTEGEAMAQARAQVLDLMAVGVRQCDIAKLMQPPMDPATLRKHFRHELALGRQRQMAVVAAVAFRLAVSGDDPAMTRFWLRTRGGWRDGAGDARSGGAVIASIGDHDGL